MSETGMPAPDPVRPAMEPTWSRSERTVPRVILRPLQEFLQTSTSGAILLFAAVVVALLWANSPWKDSYHDLWLTRVSVGVGSWSLDKDIRFWIDDGLMALFFVLVGLEIKREVVSGELRDRRAAMLPALAAVGGMIVPALVYVAVAGRTAPGGWGVPMATDIAFALGVLTLAAAARAAVAQIVAAHARDRRRHRRDHRDRDLLFGWRESGPGCWRRYP